MAADASVATTARFTSATRASSALAAALTTRRVRAEPDPRLARRGFAAARETRFPATTADIFSRCVARGGATSEVESRRVRVPTGGETRAEHWRGARPPTRRTPAENAPNQLATNSARTTIRVAFGAIRFGKIPSRAIGAVKRKSQWKSRGIFIGWGVPLWQFQIARANKFGIQGSVVWGKRSRVPTSSRGNGKHAKPAHCAFSLDEGSAAGMKCRWHQPAQLAESCPLFLGTFLLRHRFIFRTRPPPKMALTMSNALVGTGLVAKPAVRSVQARAGLKVFARMTKDRVSLKKDTKLGKSRIEIYPVRTHADPRLNDHSPPVRHPPGHLPSVHRPRLAFDLGNLARRPVKARGNRSHLVPNEKPAVSRRRFCASLRLS